MNKTGMTEAQALQVLTAAAMVTCKALGYEMTLEYAGYGSLVALSIFTMVQRHRQKSDEALRRNLPELLDHLEAREKAKRRTENVRGPREG